ncbi:MAG: RNase adapter RapZ [Thermoanaerobaculia bacterium]
MRGAADLILDSSDLSIHDARSLEGLPRVRSGRRASAVVERLAGQLRLQVRAAVARPPVRRPFLANPHFVPELRPQTGLDKPVQDYLLALDDFRDLIGRLAELLRFLLPRYQQENRSYLTIAVGCTGGQHRSVATVEALRKELEAGGWKVRVQHRELARARS